MLPLCMVAPLHCQDTCECVVHAPTCLHALPSRHACQGLSLIFNCQCAKAEDAPHACVSAHIATAYLTASTKRLSRLKMRVADSPSISSSSAPFSAILGPSIYIPRLDKLSFVTRYELYDSSTKAFCERGASWPRFLGALGGTYLHQWFV